MNTREYFAAHAPDQIPKWFQPKLPPQLPRPKYQDYKEYQSLDEQHKQDFVAWFDALVDMDEHVRLGTFIYIRDDMHKQNIEVDERIAERTAMRYFMWRVHFAKMLVQAIEIDNEQTRAECQAQTGVEVANAK